MSNYRVKGYSVTHRQEYMRNHRENNWNKYLLYAARKRDKTLSLPFDIDHSDIIIPELCPILHIPIFKGSGKLCDNSPSIDKIDPNLGYVKGNVRVISFKANKYKSDMTRETIQALLDYVNGVI